MFNLVPNTIQFCNGAFRQRDFALETEEGLFQKYFLLLFAYYNTLLHSFIARKSLLLVTISNTLGIFVTRTNFSVYL